MKTATLKALSLRLRNDRSKHIQSLRTTLGEFRGLRRQAARQQSTLLGTSLELAERRRLVQSQLQHRLTELQSQIKVAHGQISKSRKKEQFCEQRIASELRDRRAYEESRALEELAGMSVLRHVQLAQANIDRKSSDGAVITRVTREPLSSDNQLGSQIEANIIDGRVQVSVAIVQGVTKAWLLARNPADSYRLKNHKARYQSSLQANKFEDVALEVVSGE